MISVLTAGLTIVEENVPFSTWLKLERVKERIPTWLGQAKRQPEKSLVNQVGDNVQADEARCNDDDDLFHAR